MVKMVKKKVDMKAKLEIKKEKTENNDFIF